MPQSFEITSLASLRQWLKDQAGSDVRWYAAPHPRHSKRLIVSDQPWYEHVWDAQTIERRRLESITLPELGDAQEWWREIWEREIAQFWYASFPRILLMAKSSAWKAIPEQCLIRPKTEFVEITSAIFRETLGNATYVQMLNECNHCGLSTRTLDAATAEKLEQQLS